jgi:hypothetical protein
MMVGSMSAAVSTASASSGTVNASAVRPVWPVNFQPGGQMLEDGSAKNTTVTSYNWSGYAVSGSKDSYKSVSASWYVPVLSCTSDKNLYSSFWVGLDGYTSKTVEQIGTEADCDGTTPSYYAWYEMAPANPVRISFPVGPVDQMDASITFSGSDNYDLSLSDVDAGWGEGIGIIKAGLDRSSAEVITEAPTSTKSGILPLADFNTAEYWNAKVNGRSIINESPIKIIMDDKAGKDKDSTSSITKEHQGFDNTWIRST